MNATKSRCWVLVLFTIFSVSVLHGDTPAVTMRLKIESEHPLPGIPPALSVELRNASERPVTVSNRFALQVSSGSSRFIPAWTPFLRRVLAVSEIQLPQLTVSPHEDQTIVFSSSLETPEFFCDPRLSHPGSYRLQLVSDAALDSGVLTGDRIPLTTLNAPIVSNEVTLVVEEPKGEDKKVWLRMQELRIVPCSAAHTEMLAREIWQQHRSSRYAPYFVPRYEREPSDTFISRLREAMSREPSVVDRSRLTIARLQYDQMQSAIFADHDAQKALRLAGQIRETVTPVARSDSQPDLAAQALELLSTVPTDADVHRVIAEISGIIADHEPVVPLVTCARADGKEVWFGYSNPNSSAVRVPIGSRNRFDPSPAERGQPTEFLPGRHESVFKLKLKEDEPRPRWSLDGYVLTLPEKNVGGCSGD